jgi:hypothetical protein
MEELKQSDIISVGGAVIGALSKAKDILALLSRLEAREAETQKSDWAQHIRDVAFVINYRDGGQRVVVNLSDAIEAIAVLQLRSENIREERDELLETLKALPKEIAWEGRMADGTVYRKYVILADQLNAVIVSAEKRKG